MERHLRSLQTWPWCRINWPVMNAPATAQDSNDNAFQGRFSLHKYSVEERLAELLPGSEDSGNLLEQAMHSAISSAGTRIRPLLFLMIVHDLTGDACAWRDIACAIEFAHAASLILEDLPSLGNAQSRGGALPIHVSYGEDVAVLAAVALLSEAFAIIGRCTEIAALTRTRLITSLSVAGAQGLARQKNRDTRVWDSQLSEDPAVTMPFKTPASLAVAVEMAAIAGQADERITKALGKVSAVLGEAFYVGEKFSHIARRTPDHLPERNSKDIARNSPASALQNTADWPENWRLFVANIQEAERHLQDAFSSSSQTAYMLAGWFDALGMEA